MVLVLLFLLVKWIFLIVVVKQLFVRNKCNIQISWRFAVQLLSFYLMSFLDKWNLNLCHLSRRLQFSLEALYQFAQSFLTTNGFEIMNNISLTPTTCLYLDKWYPKYYITLNIERKLCIVLPTADREKLDINSICFLRLYSDLEDDILDFAKLFQFVVCSTIETIFMDTKSRIVKMMMIRCW